MAEGNKTTPIAATADRTAEKIVGSSVASNSEFYIHFFEHTQRQKLSFTKKVTEVFPNRKYFIYYA